MYTTNVNRHTNRDKQAHKKDRINKHTDWQTNYQLPQISKIQSPKLPSKLFDRAVKSIHRNCNKIILPSMLT